MKKTALVLALAAAFALGPIQTASAADVTAMQSKADSGDVQAQFELGSYLIGSGETARGILYLEAVIRAGSPNAAYAHAAMAKYYGAMGDGQIARDAMLYHYRQAAVLGDVDSQLRLGRILLDLAGQAGSNLSQKSEYQTQAQVLLEHAANAGNNSEAAYVLGEAYLYGKGMERDATRGQTWMSKAADANHVGAAYMLATYAQTNRDTKTAIRYFEMAANRGHGQAMLDLAKGYESGKLGEDLNAAKRWASKAVAANVSGAGDVQSRITGRLQLRETSVAAATRPARGAVPSMGSYETAASVSTAGVSAEPQDEVDVLRHQVEQLQRLVTDMSNGGSRARQARAEAQTIQLPSETQAEINIRLANQQGLEAHARGAYSEAYRYFSRAARGGDADAMNNMGMLLLQGQGVAQDSAKAMQLFRAAAERQHPTAAHNIGYMYEYGMGVRQDIARSRVWYQQYARLSERVKNMSNYAGL